MRFHTIQLFTLILFVTLFSCCDKPSVLETTDITDLEEETTTEVETTETSILSTKASKVRQWDWDKVKIPPHTWEEGTKFGDGLYVDIAFDPKGVSIVDNQIRFWVDPLNTPEDAPSPYNFRSEIHTDPWPINHPLGTEQWIGWTYTFGKDYVVDPTSPISIFQNHPGIRGLSPQIELELAALNSPSPAQGGEIQVVNEASSDRILYPITPKAGDQLDVVIHVIYGLGTEGLLQVWLNGTLYYDEITSTVYEDYPWGGNNKWGVYHHTFNDSAADVQSSLDAGAGTVELFMNSLFLLTRTPAHPEYGKNAYLLVRPVK